MVPCLRCSGFSASAGGLTSCPRAWSDARHARGFLTGCRKGHARSGCSALERVFRGMQSWLRRSSDTLRFYDKDSSAFERFCSHNDIPQRFFPLGILLVEAYGLQFFDSSTTQSQPFQIPAHLHSTPHYLKELRSSIAPFASSALQRMKLPSDISSQTTTLLVSQTPVSARPFPPTASSLLPEREAGGGGRLAAENCRCSCSRSSDLNG